MFRSKFQIKQSSMAKRLTNLILDTFPIRRMFSQRFRDNPTDQYGANPFPITQGCNLRSKMESGVFTWDASTMSQEEPNDSYRKSHEAKEEDTTHTMDPNSSMWRTITSDHKEIEEKPKDQTLSIQNYYRDRWIQEHKEKRSDTITKQAVKIFSDEPAPQQNPGQTPHEASIYRKLANRKIPQVNKSYDPEKDGGSDSIESIKISRRISADQFDDDDFKSIPQGNRCYSGGLNGTCAFRPPELTVGAIQNQPYTTPRFQLPEYSSAHKNSQKEHQFCHQEKEMQTNAQNAYNAVPQNNQMKYAQQNMENWSTIIDVKAPATSKTWTAHKPEAKQDSNQGNAVIQTQDPIVTFKPDM
ncbi:uncharacterized protein LOC106668674 isoform X2 [Cimex lectularius]|uniref:Uncharacterized protein n=1 Tax=Cimex lectularius TaxID=79782 RepID=A0A8I6RWT4_CIMLE|nr:uncharacterized protein LOC106668674 isoform X2 [Cimex lectularius]